MRCLHIHTQREAWVGHLGTYTSCRCTHAYAHEHHAHAHAHARTRTRTRTHSGIVADIAVIVRFSPEGSGGWTISRTNYACRRLLRTETCQTSLPAPLTCAVGRAKEASANVSCSRSRLRVLPTGRSVDNFCPHDWGVLRPTPPSVSSRGGSLAAAPPAKPPLFCRLKNEMNFPRKVSGCTQVLGSSEKHSGVACET